MKAYFSVVLIFVILYMFYLPLAYLSYAREADGEFSALLLSEAVDYAGEAAMWACADTADLEMEYTDGESMVLSPEKAADTFASVLCLSYGLPGTELNVESIQNQIPVMVLAVNDGYHLATWQTSGNGEVSLLWSIKKPYVIDTNPDDPGSGTIYGVELGRSIWRMVDKQSLSLTEGKGYEALPFPFETILQHINRAVNRDVNTILTRYALENNQAEVQQFYLPFSEGTLGVRRIESPSLLIVLQDLDLVGIRPVSLSVVNGMSLTQKQHIIAWTDGSGRRYYCRDGEADSAAQTWITLNGEVFDSIEDAARAGYLPYITG